MCNMQVWTASPETTVSLPKVGSVWSAYALCLELLCETGQDHVAKLQQRFVLVGCRDKISRIQRW